MSATEKIPDFQALREAACQVFLAASGWEGPEHQALGRQVFRLKNREGGTVILRDIGHAQALQAYKDLLQQCRDWGLRVPEILAAENDQGFALLEDFGDVPASPQAGLAVLAQLQQQDATGLPSLTDYLLQQTAAYTDWAWAARYGYETPPDITADYHDRWKRILSALPESVVVLPDFTLQALRTLKDGIGLVPSQSPLRGAPGYNIVSLLEDKAPLHEEMNVIFAAQRHLHQIGLVVATALQRHDTALLEQVPPLAARLEKLLAHPALELLQKWFTRCDPDYLQKLGNIRFFVK